MDNGDDLEEMTVPRMCNDRHDHSVPQGFVLTIVAIVIAAAFVVLVVGAAARTLTQLDIAQAAVTGTAVAAAADGCVEEALVQLRRDAAYGGGSVTIGSTSCVIVVSGSGAARTLAVTGTVGTAARTYTVGVSMSPFALTAWSE